MRLMKVDLPTLGMPMIISRTVFFTPRAAARSTAGRVASWMRARISLVLPPLELKRMAERPCVRKYSTQRAVSLSSARSALLRIRMRALPRVSFSRSGLRVASGARASQSSMTASTARS